MPNFYFLWDRIEKQVELFMPGFSTNEEDFMELLYGVRRVQKNILKKTKKKYVIACFFFCFLFCSLFGSNSYTIKNDSHQRRFLYVISLYSFKTDRKLSDRNFKVKK